MKTNFFFNFSYETIFIEKFRTIKFNIYLKKPIDSKFITVLTLQRGAVTTKTSQ